MRTDFLLELSKIDRALELYKLVGVNHRISHLSLHFSHYGIKKNYYIVAEI